MTELQHHPHSSSRLLALAGAILRVQVCSVVLRGRWELPRVLAWSAVLEQQLQDLHRTSPLPPEPDERWVDDRLHRSHLAYGAR